MCFIAPCAVQVESCLAGSVAEHLNAEICLQTIKDISMAIQWLKTTFLYVRIRKNPGHYGLAMAAGLLAQQGQQAGQQAAADERLDTFLRDK